MDDQIRAGHARAAIESNLPREHAHRDLQTPGDGGGVSHQDIRERYERNKEAWTHACNMLSEIRGKVSAARARYNDTGIRLPHGQFSKLVTDESFWIKRVAELQSKNAALRNSLRACAPSVSLCFLNVARVMLAKSVFEELYAKALQVHKGQGASLPDLE